MVLRDYVRLGRYRGNVTFGLVSGTTGTGGKWQQGGILGLGMPDEGLPVADVPLMVGLSVGPEKRRIFSLALTMEGGEMVVGGWDPHTALSPVRFFPVGADDDEIRSTDTDPPLAVVRCCFRKGRTLQAIRCV